MNILFRLLVVNLVLLVSITHNSYALEATPTNNQEPVKNAAEIQIATNKYNQKEVQKAIDNASREAKNNEENANKNIIEANKIVQESNSEQLIKIAQLFGNKNCCDLDLIIQIVILGLTPRNHCRSYSFYLPSLKV